MRIQVVANHKGGVGKTTTVFTLGHIAAAAGKRVLMIDLDAQCSLTTQCTVHEMPKRTMANVLGGNGPIIALREAIMPVAERLDVAAASDDLRHSEIHMRSRMACEKILRNALSKVRGSYDLVLVDTPPTRNLMSDNALCAADEVLIPIQPQALDMAGLQRFRGTLDEVQETVNPDLKLSGIVATFYDPRLNEHKNALRCVEDAGLPLLKTRVGRSIRVAEAAGKCQPITIYSRDHILSQRYLQLAKEIGLC